MTSVVSSFKQISADSSHFIAIAASVKVYTPASVLACAAAGGASLVAATLPAAAASVGALFKDMGKTVVASLTDGTTLTFRRVQFVDASSPATNGITGAAPGNGSDYNVGYVLLGLNGAGTSTTATGAGTFVLSKVAKYGL